MRNIKLTIRYDGTNYSGWQFQKNAKSIQGTIEGRLKKILGKKVTLVGAGRTDAGVHAKAQVANFKTKSDTPLENLKKALNSLLPKDIVICGIAEVGLKFDSQRAAKSKLYRYTIMNDDFLDPFIRPFATKCFYKLDLKRMRQGARYLIGRHDFSGFQKRGGKEKNSVRVIKKIKIEKEGEVIYIDIEARGFLYNMARNIVGTLIELSRGKIKRDDIASALVNRDKKFCGPTAPAKGLSLLKVTY